VIDVRISMAVACLRLPLKKALHTAADLGARGVVLDARNQLRPEEFSQTAVRQFKKLLEDLNLQIVGLSFQTRRGYAVREELDRRVEATKAALKFAADLRAPVVINQVGRVPEDESSLEWRTMLEVLSDIGNFGHRTGALLAAKTGSESGPDLARLLAAIPDGMLGIDLDPGNLIINGFSADEALQALGPHILHATAHDGVRDLAAGRGLEVQLGRGTADFPAILARLEQYDYRGWLTIDRRESEDAVKEAGEAVQYLRSLV